jgi:hypothetical protein
MKPLKALLCASFVLGLSTAGGPGAFIICIGGDGHVAFEAANDSCCSAPLHSAFAVAADRCASGGCVDLFVSANAQPIWDSRPAENNSGAGHARLLATPSQSAAAEFLPYLPTVRRDRSDFPQPAATGLRTTILLI